VSNQNEVGPRSARVFRNYELAKISATTLNNASAGVIALPILSGGLTKGGNVATSGQVLVRELLVCNPSGSLASANISIGYSSDGSNLVVANTVISNVSAVGTFQEVVNSPPIVVSGYNSQCLYVNVNTASGNANTCDIIIYGTVVTF